MDRLDAMALLVAAVDEGSLSAAGRKLGVPLPTISRKIAELEAHVKTRLLLRSTRKLALTEAGAGYVAACRRILEEIDEAESKAAGEYSAPRGELAITAPIVFGRLHVGPIVNAFLAEYPEINIRMILSDRTIDLLDEHIDLAVRIGDLPDSSLVATGLGTLRRVVCGSPAYLAEHGVPNTPADLDHHRCVTFAVISTGASWVFRPSGRPMKVARPLCRLQINTAEAAIDAAVAGVGLTRVLSYQAASAVREGRLAMVLEEYEPRPVPVHLVHAHQGESPLKARRFMKFAAPRLRASLLATEQMLRGEAEAPSARPDRR